MRNRTPEAFFIYRELVQKISRHKEELKRKYNKKIDTLTSEINFLKEQIEAQNTMLAQAMQYAEKLEDQVTNIGRQNDGKNKKNDQ